MSSVVQEAVQKIEVRKATEDDYQGVLDINQNVYGGLDYIPIYYHELVTDPDISYYVCMVDDEVGAFEGMALIDGGRTLMTRSARVKDKFQGRGLLALIRKQIYDDFKSLPGVERIRTCCANSVRLVDSARFLSENKTLATRMLISFEPMDGISLLDSLTEEVPEAHELSWDGFAKVLQSPTLVNYLFPEGFITCASWFFDPLISNIKHLKKLATTITMSVSLANSISKHLSADSFGAAGDNGAHEDLMKGLMCIASHYFVPAGLLYVLEISGKGASVSEEELRNLIVHSLKNMFNILQSSKKSKCRLFCGISVHIDEDDSIFHRIVTPYGFHLGAANEMFNKHYFFEQSFEQLAV